jgi:hypothetical protein
VSSIELIPPRARSTDRINPEKAVAHREADASVSSIEFGRVVERGSHVVTYVQVHVYAVAHRKGIGPAGNKKKKKVVRWLLN